MRHYHTYYSSPCCLWSLPGISAASTTTTNHIKNFQYRRANTRTVLAIPSSLLRGTLHQSTLSVPHTWHRAPRGLESDHRGALSMRRVHTNDGCCVSCGSHKHSFRLCSDVGDGPGTAWSRMHLQSLRARAFQYFDLVNT